MPTPTYKPLATITLGSSASSVTFSSIPSTYKDLVVVTSVFQNFGGDTYTDARYNSDTASNYSLVFMDTYGGNPSSGASTRNAVLWEYHQTVASTTPSTTVVQIMDYSATDKHKTALHRFGAASPTVGAYATRWANTAAITSLQIFVGAGGNYLANSTFSLYGIVA